MVDSVVCTVWKGTTSTALLLLCSGLHLALLESAVRTSREPDGKHQQSYVKES